MFTIPLPHFLPQGWINKLWLVWNSLSLATASSCYNGIICHLVGDSLPPQQRYIHLGSRLGHNPPIETCQVKYFFVACSSILSLYHPSTIYVCVCACFNAIFSLGCSQLWISESCTFSLSSKGEWMREDVLSLGHWGIRTPEHTKVCAGPLKHSVILHGIHFGLSVFLCIAKRLLYKYLGSILRHNRCAPNSKAVPKCIQYIRFGQNPWQNHVYPLLRKQSQNALWARLQRSKWNVNYTYLLCC